MQLVIRNSFLTISLSDGVFADILKSPACEEILFNRLKNVEKQMNEILLFAKSTQERQIKGERELNDLNDSIQFISDKFKEYEEDHAKQLTNKKPSIESQDFIE